MPFFRAGCFAVISLRHTIASMVGFLLVCIFLPHSASAQSTKRPLLNVQIVVDDNSETTKAIVADLAKKLPSGRIRIVEDADAEKPSNHLLVITIGPSALRSFLRRSPDGAVLSAFTSSQAFNSIIESEPAHTGPLAALYAEPSPEHQLRLISLLFNKNVKVAALLSEKTAYFGPLLERAAARNGHSMTLQYVSREEDINDSLSRISGIPVIVAVPDNTIYNAENVRNILMTTYRRRQALVGFSAALVKTGALASTYSDIADIADQVVAMVGYYDANGKLPASQFPKYFRVVVNEDVARSLNIIVDEQAKNYSNSHSESPR